MKTCIKAIWLMVVTMPVMADTYWLNISGAEVITPLNQSHSLSIPVSSLEQCEKSLVEYANLDAVFYISCSRVPLSQS